MLRYFVLIIIFIFSFTALYAQGVEFDYYSIVDWGKGEMLINVETVFSPGSGTLRIRDNSEDIFKENFFKIFLDSIKKDKYGQIYFNSSFSVEEKIQAITYLRECFYGEEATTGRIQRVCTMFKLK